MMEWDLHSVRLFCLADTQKDVVDMTSFAMLVALEKGGWIWHPIPKKNKRAAVVKITCESEDTIVAPEGLVWWHAALVHQGLGESTDDALGLCRPRRDELAHLKDEKYYARLVGERPHDGMELDGPVNPEHAMHPRLSPHWGAGGRLE